MGERFQGVDGILDEQHEQRFGRHYSTIGEGYLERNGVLGVARRAGLRCRRAGQKASRSPWLAATAMAMRRARSTGLASGESAFATCTARAASGSERAAVAAFALTRKGAASSAPAASASSSCSSLREGGAPRGED